MSATTGLGLLDLAILEAIEAADARHDRQYLKTRHVLDVLHERTGIGPSQAYESLCGMARPDVVQLALVDFHGNYGSPDFGPAEVRYTECRLTKLGEAALAAERGELGALPIGLINGDLHHGGRRPPLDPRRVVEAIRAAAAGASDDSISRVAGLPSFPSGCTVTGDLALFASGAACEIVASAAMVDGHARDRSTVTITALPPFTSANKIVESVHLAVTYYARERLGLPPPTGDETPCPVAEVNDGSAGDETRLIVVARPGVSHAELRRFLDAVRNIHQRVQVELRRPSAASLRDYATKCDLTLDTIEQAMGARSGPGDPSTYCRDGGWGNGAEGSPSRPVACATRHVPCGPVVTIRAAETHDLDALVRLEGELFATDAAAHEPFVDPTWPAREGRRDFERLLADERSVVLVADLAGPTIGLLVGYLARSSPTRLPSTYAVLRSIYIDVTQQRQGVGTSLVEAFISWARSHGCDEAHVDAYAANVGAHAFYERHGFAPRSLSLALTL